MQTSTICDQQGFTLLEVVISMVIGLIILTALTETFQLQRQLYSTQDQVNEMLETARASMDVVSREVKLAGYNPSGASYLGIPYYANLLRIRTDSNGDGIIDDATEDVIYQYDGTNSRILRIPFHAFSTTTDFQPYVLADNIQAFSFKFLDKSNNETTDSVNIQKVRIRITARTAKPDPHFTANNGRRTFTLESLVTPINLSL